MANINKTVVVGMSGGVDSSVAAYLLQKEGYNVQGLFMQNWQNEPGEVCTSELDFKDASKVCDQLNIPLHKANFSDEYWDRVFKEFLSEHEKGRTPNPDILCNREIKFKSFLDYAIKIGADHIATGHYAKIESKDNKTLLMRSKDLNKDLKLLSERIIQGQQAYIKDLSKTITSFSKLLNSLSYKSILNRGFSVTRNSKKEIVKSKKNLSHNESLKIETNFGTLHTVLEKIDE